MALHLRLIVIFVFSAILIVSSVVTSQAAEEKEALIFEDALPFSEGLAAVRLNGKWGYINEAGRIVIQPTFDRAEKFFNGVAIVWQSNKCGYIDNKGHIIVEPQFESILHGNQGEVDLIIREQDGKRLFGGFNRKNKKLFSPTFRMDTAISLTDTDMMGYRIGEKVGLMNSSFQMVTSLIYDNIGPFSKGYAVISSDGKYGLINKKGEVVLEPQYEDLNYFHDDIAIFRQDGKYGFINIINRQILIPAVYDNFYMFSKGMARVSQNKKWGIIDKNCQVILPMEYDNCWFFNAWGIFEVSLQGKVGLVDNKGTVVIEPMYDAFSSPYGDYLPAQKDGKWGIITRDGQVILDFAYERYQNGKLCLNGKWGYYDIKKHEMVLEPLYDDVEFSGEVFWVKVKEKWGCLNKEGQMIISPTYDAVIAGGKMPLTLLLIQQSPYPKWGVANQAGKVLYEPQFDYFPFWAYTHFSPDMKYSVAAKNGRVGYITSTGDWLGIRQ